MSSVCFARISVRFFFAFTILFFMLFVRPFVPASSIPLPRASFLGCLDRLEYYYRYSYGVPLPPGTGRDGGNFSAIFLDENQSWWCNACGLLYGGCGGGHT